MGFNLKKGKVTDIKSEGVIKPDGTIIISKGQVVNDFANLLKSIHQKTCINLPDTTFIWEEGITKSHVKVFGFDHKAENFKDASIKATADLLSKTSIAPKLADFIPQIANNPSAFTYEMILSNIEEKVGSLGCIHTDNVEL